MIRRLFVLVCALLISAASACSNEGGSGGIGGAGGQACAAPLADYCEGADCPSYEEAVETAKDWRCEDISDSAEVGTCGDLMYARLGLGIGSGQEQYFDAEGTLTAIYFHTDTPSYCDETSFGKWYGPSPDCEQTPSEIFCSGGMGGEDCPLLSCPPVPGACSSAATEPIAPCCELPSPPEQPNACRGDESTVSPSSCARGGVTNVYRITVLGIDPDCNEGFDLDGCSGSFCSPPAVRIEGIDGVDNYSATINEHVAVNQLLSDALCGAGPGAGGPCDGSVPRLELGLAFELNPDEQCANVIVMTAGEEAARTILNLSDAKAEGTYCASGELGTIPLRLGDEEIELQALSASVTVSEAGLSDGRIGAVLDTENAAQLLGAASPGFSEPLSDYLDMFVGPWCGEEIVCNAMSGTYRMAGVPERLR